MEIKTNAAFSLGDLPIVISEAGTNRNAWGAKDYPYSVTFSSLRDLDGISSLEFFDAETARKWTRKNAPGAAVFWAT